MTVEEWEQRLAECEGNPKEYQALMRNRPKEIPANGIRVGSRGKEVPNTTPFLANLQTGGK